MIFLNNMKLLIVTQAVDAEDPVLGFFVRWIEELATRNEKVAVICLREGRHELPSNVKVYGIGKAGSRRQKAVKFISLVLKLRDEYDAVFVHMNQEYILIAGWLWKLLGKRVYMWRNHYAGSWLTDVAATFCTKVFCTSKHSHTAKYKKTILMPVGVDTERFYQDTRVPRVPHSILFLSRMTPSKRPEMLIDALTSLARNNIKFTTSFIGSPLPKDEIYYEELREKAKVLGDKVSFLPGIPNSQTPDVYRAHEIFVNTSPSGMLDKTIFEAAACGCVALAASDDWKKLAGEEYSFGDADSLATRLQTVLPAHSHDKKLESIAHSQNLSVLAEKLMGAMI